MEIMEDPEAKYLNARQTLLRIKEGHGTGAELTFPGTEEIHTFMDNDDESFMVKAYGDGSLTSPTKQWAALGGMGAWIPQWNVDSQDERNVPVKKVGNSLEAQNVNVL